MSFVYHFLGVFVPFFVVGFVTMWLRTCTLTDQVQALTHRSEVVENDCQHRVQSMDTQVTSLRNDVRTTVSDVTALKPLDEHVRSLRERVQEVEASIARRR